MLEKARPLGHSVRARLKRLARAVEGSGKFTEPQDRRLPDLTPGTLNNLVGQLGEALAQATKASLLTGNGHLCVLGCLVFLGQFCCA